MGNYGINKQEIKDEFKKMLENLEGDVWKKDVEQAVKEVIRSYQHFS